MANTFFSFTPFDFDGIQGSYGSLEDFEKEEAVFKEKQNHLFELIVGETNPISTEYGFHQGDRAKKGADHLLKDQLQHPQHQQPKSNNLTSDEFHFNTVFPPTQSIRESTELAHIPTRVSEILEHDKQIPHPSSLAFLELLRNDGSGFQKLQGEKLSDISAATCVVNRKLSTEEIMRVAGARYVQFSTRMYDDYYMPTHPFGFALSGLSEDEKRDVELAHILLAAAEKVGYQQYDRASRLLLRCEWISSSRCNPVQRVVFHFAEALREKIEKESGRVTVKGLDQNDAILQDLGSNLTLLKFYEQLPFTQITLFTGIQAIIENVALKRKVHLIDIEIRSGVHWSLLMQSLAERQDFPIELLKITAVGSTGNERIEKTGKRLASVAESLNLPFSFKLVLLSDMKDIKEELFEIEDDEAVIIFAPLVLRTMISMPNCLENFMRVIRNLNPSIMVVFEVEANHNSPSFVNRFIEALFFYCAYYDSLETCMKQYDEDRIRMEKLLGDGIRNLVAEDGRGRTNRNVTIDVWRAFFSRFRMVEIGFSESSLHQASLVVERFSCRNYCTLDKNGKSLLVGWKGTPLHSLSVWKFS